MFQNSGQIQFNRAKIDKNDIVSQTFNLQQVKGLSFKGPEQHLLCFRVSSLVVVGLLQRATQAVSRRHTSPEPMTCLSINSFTLHQHPRQPEMLPLTRALKLMPSTKCTYDMQVQIQ